MCVLVHQKVQRALFIRLICENIQLHDIHIFFLGRKKEVRLDLMSTPNFPPLLYSLTPAESGLYLQGFQFLHLSSVTQPLITLTPLLQTYFQDAGFQEVIRPLSISPSSFQSVISHDSSYHFAFNPHLGHCWELRRGSHITE